MTKPITVPNTFATATTTIPLSQLDSNFTTVSNSINDANTYSNYAADTGVANAYVVTFSSLTTTYAAGLRIQFKATNANTGASTINVNGQGVKNITYANGTNLGPSTILANAIVDIIYDGTQFLLLNTHGYFNVPPVGSKTSSYTLAKADIGKYVEIGSGGSIVIPDAVFANGDVVGIANNTSSNVTITCTITTAYLSGTDGDKATVQIQPRGVGSVLFLSGTVCIITGAVTP
jgi:hypothetical protein